jgi:hypothetical protein
MGALPPELSLIKLAPTRARRDVGPRYRLQVSPRQALARTVLDETGGVVRAGRRLLSQLARLLRTTGRRLA